MPQEPTLPQMWARDWGGASRISLLPLGQRWWVTHCSGPSPHPSCWGRDSDSWLFSCPQLQLPILIPGPRAGQAEVCLDISVWCP